MPVLYRYLFKKQSVSVVISEHFDGEVISRIIRFFDILSIRGSSRKGAAKAMINIIKSFKDGSNIGITPDGPKGPLHSVSESPIYLANKLGADILFFTYKASSFWRLGSWDGFVIPKPFSKVEFFVTDIEAKNSSMLREEMLKYTYYKEKE
jgi:hypothetical protein